MELGVAGWSLHREILEDKKTTLLDLPEVVAGYGVKVIELCQVFFENTSPDYLNQVRQALEKEDLRVVNIAVDVGNLAEPDAAKRRTHVEALKQWFHVAKAVGSEAIRINSGFIGPQSFTLSSTPVPQEVLDRVVEGYRELAKVAEFTGVRLLIENHGGPSADPENIRYFIEKVGSDWFRTCPDFGNFLPGTTYRGLGIMLPYAYSVHAKLVNVDSEVQVLERQGVRLEYDLRRCLDLVKDSGYDGPLCLEWGGPEPAEREAIKSGLELVASLL